MASRVVMPKLTDTMEEGVVVKWKKKEGEAVGAGDVLAEIETDKAVMDLEAFTSGVLRRVVAAEGETVKAGSLIGVIAEPDEDIASLLAEPKSPAPTSSATSTPTLPTGQPQPPAAAAAAPPATEAAPAPAVKASPRAKALARERGIDLAAMTGSGPEGRIVEEDVLKASTKLVPPSGSTDRPLSQMRKAMARTTSQSKGPVAHFDVTTEVDMEEADRFRHQFKQARATHPGLNDMILKAVAMALARHPEINVSFAGEVIRQHG